MFEFAAGDRFQLRVQKHQQGHYSLGARKNGQEYQLPPRGALFRNSDRKAFEEAVECLVAELKQAGCQVEVTWRSTEEQ